jgi:hypothetical protein
MLVHGGLLHACAKLYQNLCRRSTYMHLEEVVADPCTLEAVVWPEAPRWILWRRPRGLR